MNFIAFYRITSVIYELLQRAHFPFKLFQPDVWFPGENGKLVCYLTRAHECIQMCILNATTTMDNPLRLPHQIHGRVFGHAEEKPVTSINVSHLISYGHLTDAIDSSNYIPSKYRMRRRLLCIRAHFIQWQRQKCAPRTMLMLSNFLYLAFCMIFCVITFITHAFATCHRPNVIVYLTKFQQITAYVLIHVVCPLSLRHSLFSLPLSSFLSF